MYLSKVQHAISLSANQNPGVVHDYQQKEVRLGRVIGPMGREDLPEAPIEQIWGN